MSALAFPGPRKSDSPAGGRAHTSAAHPYRWRLNRAGIVNVWFYFDQRFTLSGGRLVLRGSNGSGKSRALEMLLPFVLDADRRRMDATGSGKVRLEDLMRAGGDGQTNRLGYVWLELTRDVEDTGSEQRTEFLTTGALIRFSHSTAEAKAWYFLTPLRVDEDLVLLDTSRVPLSKEGLTAVIGADRLTSSPDVHRDRVRTAVFGLHGGQGRERYTGLLQLLHTLRSPDVGNRIDEGRLPQILSDALPPLSDKAIATAGEELDGLEETRAALARLETAYGHVADFLRVYTRYATGVCITASDRTQAAAVLARDTDATAAQREKTYLQLVRDHADAVAKSSELDGYRDELEATVAGIRQSSEYKAARELSERLSTLQALEAAARNAMATAKGAREEEQRSADACNEAAQDAKSAADEAAEIAQQAGELLVRAGLNTPLPLAPGVEVRPPDPVVEPVRTTADADPEPVSRPAALCLVPAPEHITETTDELRAAMAALRSAAATRAQQAAARAGEANELASSLEKVRRAQDRAEDAAADAVTAEGKAEQAETSRDEAAANLAVDWRTWTSSARSQRLLGGVDWYSTAVATLLDDIEALAGDVPAGPEADRELARLDALAHQVAAPARALHAQQTAALAAQAQQEQARRKQLLAEAGELRAERDVPPAVPDWLDSPPPGAPALWQLLEFRPEVDAPIRAGVEGALLASGLLYGVLTQDGDVVVGNGQLLLGTGGPPALRSLRTLLVPARSDSREVARVNAVLDQVALSPGHPTWVSSDGSWGNGPLSGRHLPATARYVGATARAAARAARLAEIDVLLEQLQQAAQARSEQQDALEAGLRDLESHLMEAPRSVQLATLRLQAASARTDAVAGRRQAGVLAEEAERMQRAWTARQRSHREVCAALGMPDDADGLRTMQACAEQSQTMCRNVDRAGEAVKKHLARQQLLLAGLHAVRGRRSEAEEHAGSAALNWSREASALAALRESLGSSPQEVHDRLDAAERELKRTKETLQRTSSQVLDLTGQVAAAKEKAQGAREKAYEAQGALVRQAKALHGRLSHPALAVALVPGAVAPAVLLSARASADDVLAVMGEVRAAVQRPDSTADATALVRAQSVLERNTAGAYDVTVTIEDELHVVELTDASGRRHIADAAAELRERRDRGRGALTQRERTAFHNFVLGGMAEELRNRILEAESLIKAMNTSLQPITTSHGIGVKVRWRLADSANEHITRIKELMKRDVHVLRETESEELISRLKALVDTAYSADPQAGYATHLHTALDYRAWHVVDAFITGPEPGQERKISRRAKLSQGETRFVSYVTLFAAADAYLSSLPDTGRALRLILLDDAFAKVDHRTIGELMALLVRLDLDFVMTGHALWGFFPEVPALDTYEVRRAEGTAAVTTHVHWDGRTRHLRAAS
ncbi:TIGR02680 family protein [Streptomyces odonnellii]|uniref:TIGR02680 family protein n=1 Tax=Streptomyces odonnellii TaxID=1417980 RepID=UPI0006984FBE|nr:TIGR02680 family protein [Streptomyces odonnellii]